MFKIDQEPYLRQHIQRPAWLAVHTMEAKDYGQRPGVGRVDVLTPTVWSPAM